jgi:hypothetical protein
MTDCTVGVYRQGFGGFLAHTRDDRAEKKGEACGDERDNSSLDLKQSKVAEDEGVPDGRDVKVTHVGCSSKTSRKVHLYVAFKVKDDGHDGN